MNKNVSVDCSFILYYYLIKENVFKYFEKYIIMHINYNKCI